MNGVSRDRSVVNVPGLPVADAARRLVQRAMVVLSMLAGCTESAATPTDQTHSGTAGSGGSGGSAAAAGSGGPSSGGAGGLGDGKAGGDGVVACTHATCSYPPEPVSGGAGASSGMDAINIQAITHLYLGDGTRSGVASADAWEELGFAISGSIFTDPTSGAAHHCKPYPGAKPADVIVNGKTGIDNSFGKNVLPWLMGADAIVARTQQAIDQGAITSLFLVYGLGASDHQGLQATFAPVLGGALGVDAGAPVEWTTFPWRPVAGWQSTFDASYLVGGTWVSAPKADLRVVLPWGTGLLVLTIHRAVVSHHHADDFLGSSLGVISGILDGQELLAAVKATVPESFCSSAALEGPFDELLRARDIGLDGTQDPTKECEGISIGLGYDTTAAALGDAIDITAPTGFCQ